MIQGKDSDNVNYVHMYVDTFSEMEMSKKYLGYMYLDLTSLCEDLHLGSTHELYPNRPCPSQHEGS